MPHAVELAHELIGGDGPASRRVVFLHGLLGRGSNLRTLARRFLQQRPGWDALLVDLRGHGASPKGSPDPTITAAAADVRQLCGVRPPTAIVGHSFGGKVALALADLVAAHVVTLDSNPGPKSMTGPGSPGEVLPVLRTLPDELPNRTAFVEALTARGLSLPLAQWLSMSTETTAGGGVRFALDLAEVTGLWASHRTTDLWPVVSTPPPGVSVHLVIAERSAAYDAEDRTRAAGLVGERLSVDVLAADHWLHASNPDAVLRVLWSHLPQ